MNYRDVLTLQKVTNKLVFNIRHKTSFKQGTNYS